MLFWCAREEACAHAFAVRRTQDQLGSAAGAIRDCDSAQCCNTLLMPMDACIPPPAPKTPKPSMAHFEARGVCVGPNHVERVPWAVLLAHGEGHDGGHVACEVVLAAWGLHARMHACVHRHASMRQRCAAPLPGLKGAKRAGPAGAMQRARSLSDAPAVPTNLLAGEARVLHAAAVAHRVGGPRHPSQQCAGTPPPPAALQTPRLHGMASTPR